MAPPVGRRLSFSSSPDDVKEMKDDEGASNEVLCASAAGRVIDMQQPAGVVANSLTEVEQLTEMA